MAILRVFTNTCTTSLYYCDFNVSLFIPGSLFLFQLISEEIADLRHNHATTMAKLAQFKRKHLELSHRILEVMLTVKLL